LQIRATPFGAMIFVYLALACEFSRESCVINNEGGARRGQKESGANKAFNFKEILLAFVKQMDLIATVL